MQQRKSKRPSLAPEIPAVKPLQNSWLLLMAGFFIPLSLWQVWEVDIYWMIRAGVETLQNLSISMTETWSYTVNGSPWLNTHWLSEILAALAFHAGGEAAVIIVRSLSVAGLIYLVLKATKPTNVLEAAILVTLFYLAVWFRMSFRAEQFVLICFAALVLLREQRTWTNKKILWMIGLVFLSAQLHAGSAYFCAGLAGVMVLESPLPARLKVGVITAMGLAVLLTPVHVKSLTFVMNHLFYFGGKVLTNPDHQPISWEHFSFGSLPGVGWGFVLLMVTALPRFLGAMKQSRREIFYFGFTLLMIVASFNRDRGIPFASILLAPYSSTSIRTLVGGLTLSTLNQTMVSVLFFLCLMFHARVNPYVYPWSDVLLKGFVPDARIFPVQAVEFLKRVQPKENLYHTFTFGAYLVWHLRDYKIFGDTRETPFKSLEKDYFEAYGSPEASQRLYDRFKINSLLMPIPRSPDFDIIERYNPSSDWAIVYFDQLTVVVVRKIPEHEALINDHQFKILKPHMPPGLYASLSMRTKASDERFELEIARCREQATPYPTYCDLAWASYKSAERSGLNGIQSR